MIIEEENRADAEMFDDSLAIGIIIVSYCSIILY